MARNAKPAAEVAKTPSAETEAPATEMLADTGAIEGGATVVTEQAVELPAEDAPAAEGTLNPASSIEGEAQTADLGAALAQALAQSDPLPPIPAGMDLELVSERMVAVITATVPRRRRAGCAFGPTPTRIPVEDLTDEDFDALAADPVLKIHMEPAENPAGE